MKNITKLEMLFNLPSGEPDIVIKLILALGLGSSGQYISPEGTPGPTNITNPLHKFTCTDCEDPLQVCRHVTVPPRTGRYITI